MEQAVAPNAGHRRMSNPEEVRRTSETGYKRFRRRGNKADIQHIDPVTPAVKSAAKPIAVPVPILVPGPRRQAALVQADRILVAEPVVPQSDEMWRWNALRQVTLGGRQNFTGHTPLVSFNRNDPASKAFDQLRTRLLQTLRSNGWSRIAIAAPTPGCGSTFTAVNLGLSFARIPGSRTVLMDLNLRSPGIANALGVQSTGDVRGYLSGQIDAAKYLVGVKDTLALGLVGESDQDAAELLHDQRTAVVLDAMNANLAPDVTLYDLPPILAYDDLAAFLPQVDGVLLVSDGTKTTAAEIEACEHVLEGQTKVLGVILNQARSSGLQSYDA